MSTPFGNGIENDAALEWKLRAIAPPVVLGLAWLVCATGTGPGFVRVFFSMWLHEAGHAVTAWLAGFVSFPGPWRTSIADERSPIFVIMVFAALAGGAIYAWQTRKRVVLAVLGAAILAQIVLTLFTSRAHAHTIVFFMGDGGGMVLGTLLVATFFVDPESPLHTTWLRWGFLVIGAFGFMDPFHLWWRARHDWDVIPFGEIDGVGDSDPTQLTDGSGWSVRTMIARYVALGVTCLVVMAIVYLLGLRRRVSRPES